MEVELFPLDVDDPALEDQNPRVDEGNVAAEAYEAENAVEIPQVEVALYAENTLDRIKNDHRARLQTDRFKSNDQIRSSSKKPASQRNSNARGGKRELSTSAKSKNANVQEGADSASTSSPPSHDNTDSQPPKKKKKKPRRRTTKEPEVATEPLHYFEPVDETPNSTDGEELRNHFRRRLAYMRNARRFGGRYELNWLEWFVKGEHLYFNEKKHNITIHENGHNWKEKLGNFTNVHLFKNKEGLGMTIPEDLGLETVTEYINPKTMVNVIVSGCETQDIDITMGALMEEFNSKPEERPRILNMISLEFGRTKEKLDELFEVPAFVDSMSLAQIITSTLKRLLDIIDVFLAVGGGGFKKTELNRERIEYESQLRRILSYHKFLLVSMKGSFSDVHIDFSSTCVFYHVKKGKKVFYVAPLTEYTWKVYQEFESGQRPNEWIVDVLFDHWERVEINEGETAMIPSGYLHFVWTPEDSLVIGGNFLMQQSLESQFDLSTFERECRLLEKSHLDKGHLYQNFFNIMWCYVKNILSPALSDLLAIKENGELDAEQETELASLIEAGQICCDKLKTREPVPDRDWYKDERPEILEELKDMLPEPAAPRQGATSQGFIDIPGFLYNKYTVKRKEWEASLRMSQVLKNL